MDGPTLESWPFVGRAADLDLVERTLADPALRALVITAPAGAGKTRLARQATTGATPPLWLHASPAVAAVPFGVLAHLDDLAVDDPTQVYRRLARDAADAGGVVVVDDAPHLDARTADLLHRLVEAGAATVIATARAGVEVPPWLEWLWLGEATRHLELGPLGEAEVARLVTAVVGDLAPHRHGRVVRTLAARTGGNALFLRELLLDLRERGDIEVEAALDGAAPAHLLRVLQARIDAAGDVVVPLRAASVLGDLPLAILRGRATDTEIDAAEAGGWLAIDLATRPTARPAHPLYAEAALAAMTTLERTALTEQVGRNVLDATGATAGERLRATAALVDLGVEVGVALLVEAARTAFSALDHDLAVRLGQAAVDGGDPFEALLVLGAAHSGAGRADDAETSLRAALAAAATDDQMARSAGRLSVHLVAHGARVDEASALLAEIEPLLVAPAARSFVAADRAKLASIQGDLTAVVTDLDDDADDLTRLNTAIVGAYLAAMAGDADACRATIAEALPLADVHRTVLPWSSQLVRFSGPFAALLEAGPAAAEAEARAGGSGAGPAAEATSGTWHFLAGFAAAVGGRLHPAATALDQAAVDLDGHDLINARPLAIAARAWVAAQAGQVDLARTLLDASVDAAATDGRVRVQVAVADAWCDVAESGRPADDADPRIADRIVETAREAAAGAQGLTAVIVLHELVRLGHAAAASAALATVAGTLPSSWFVRLVVDRAGAEADGDEAAMARLARHAGTRWPLVAAELHAARARLARRRHDEVGAGRAAVVALATADALGPERPASLTGLASPLTARELEVACAVAAGATNRAVAEAAAVSVRTVENQLQSTYRKLALDGRQDLLTLLAPG